tara:strand:+ start:8510 stop:9172 length:663 start_codon:yes stop_codon:yes gene_type:complete
MPFVCKLTIMSLSTRLKKARMRKHMTQQQLASQVGIKQQAVQRIEAGKVKSTSYVVQIAHALDVSPDWLALGPGDEPVTRHLVAEENADHTAEPGQVPLIEWHQLHDVPHARDNARTKVPTCIPVSSKAFALRVNDDSMVCSDGNKTSLHRNDILIIDPSKSASDNNFVLARIPQTAIRQFVSDDNGGYLKALNHKYESVTCDFEHKAIGVVTERITQLV